MGTKRQRDGNRPKLSAPSTNDLPLEENPGARGSDLPKGNPAESRSGSESLEKRETESQRIWGEDWTILTIGDRRHYLLTIIDYFSRFLIAWGVVPTVTQKEVQNLLYLSFLSEGLEHQKRKPILRVDLGSPNIARNTKRLIKDLVMLLSLSLPHRPTDNAR
jgi:transposase InsO family protein